MYAGSSYIKKTLRYSQYLQLRVVEDLDFASMPSSETYKGSALGSPYQPPEPVPTGPVPEGSTQYNGSCHCGAVAYTLLNPEKITSARDCKESSTASQFSC